MRRTLAFTLTELLIVLGIIVLLVGILFPVIAKARRQAQLTQCLSNLRQIGIALIAYATDNNGWFPAPAMARAQQPDDWVCWQPGRDPARGQLYRYLGKRLDVLKCPSGVPERGPTIGPYGTFPPYPYSYSLNMTITGFTTREDVPRGRPTATDYCTLGMMALPSQKVLALEEDTVEINDGAWYPHGDRVSLQHSSVSVMHQLGWGDGDGDENSSYLKRGSGPVVFADGHADLLDRQSLQGSMFIDGRWR